MTLDIRGLSKFYGTFQALNEIDLSVGDSEFVCLLGPSGCGKTTLLRVIAGLESFETGEMILGGRDLATIGARDRGFGIVFQSYSLFPQMTAAQNIGYGLKLRQRPRAEISARVEELLALVRLEQFADRLPWQLSGGQQQRVAIARALAVQPALLLLDEPLSALDARVRAGLRTEIRQMQKRLGIPTIMVTHDQEEALTMSDRIAVMSAGRIQQLGAPREIYTKPRNRFVASFIGETNFLTATGVPGGAKLASGEVIAVDTGGKGGQITLAVRPEHVEITPPDAQGTIPAEVRGSVYFGTDMNYQIVLPDGTGIEACVQSGVTGEALIGQGAKVGIRFAPGSVLMLED